MMVRRSIPAVSVLAAVSLVVIASADSALVLGLLPALALFLPLLADMFPGERAIVEVGRWLDSIRPRAAGRPPAAPIEVGREISFSRPRGLGLRTRGPPRPAPTI